MKFKLLNVLFIGGILTFSHFSSTVHAGLISAWDLTSDFNDSSGNEHHGTGFGNVLPSFSNEAPINLTGSASFNKSNYIALNQFFQGDDSIAEMSASAWFQTSYSSGNWTSNWALLDFDRSEFFNLFITNTGQVGFSTAAGSINDMFSQTSGLNDGEWHHVTITYGVVGGKSIYIDGALDSSIGYLGAIGTSSSRYGFIGDGSEASDFNGSRNNIYYDGKISNVKLWDNSLTAAEVQTEAVALLHTEIPEPSTLALLVLGIIGFTSRRINK